VQTTAKLVARPNLLTVVLVSPRIPPNTGNIARMCACTGLKLALVEPLGFSIADRELKRAGLDYWDKVFLQLYPTWEAYVAAHQTARRFLFTARAGTGLWQLRFAPGDHLVFGSETTGLAAEILESGLGTQATIPMLDERRSLNLSTAAGVVAYEALRQLCG
jgi:tRNA (cytidine/uridine-2'-O-)-methyltransferase